MTAMTTTTTSTAAKTDKGCSEDNCPGKHYARGYCRKHYEQKRAAGEFTGVRPPRESIPDKGCSVDDCLGKHIARGYCRKHYDQKMSAEGSTDVRPKRKPKTEKGCSEDNCLGKHSARGYCDRHYQQKKKAGAFTDLRPKRKPNMDDEGLRAYIQASSAPEDTGYRTPCWTWMGAMNGPYGHASYNDPNSATRRPIRAHRLSYRVFNGPLVDGLVVDHLCHHKACVNPEHLRQVTQQENVYNRKGASTGSTSGVRGVGWNKTLGKWEVKATYNGTRHYGGAFTDLNEAEQAAIALRERISAN